MLVKLKSSDMKIVSIVLIWILLWFGLGMVTGKLNGEHGWLIFPILGGIFGAAGGLCFALIVKFSGNYQRLYSYQTCLLPAMASAASILPIGLLAEVSISYLVLFWGVSGLLSGTISSFVFQTLVKASNAYQKEMRND